MEKPVYTKSDVDNAKAAKFSRSAFTDSAEVFGRNKYGGFRQDF